MSLPKIPTPETIKYYLDSKLFWTQNWDSCTACDTWYSLQKLTQDMKIESVLNVGIGPLTQAGQWNKLLRNIYDVNNFINIDVVEDFVTAANSSNDIMINNSVLCDVKKVDTVFAENTFDFTLWSHGPEHIYREEWAGAFVALEKVTSKIVVLQCPWGGGYDYDPEHVSKSVNPEEFENFGYSTVTCGRKNSKDTNILAWKIL